MLDEIRALLVLQDRDRKRMSALKDLAKIPEEETRSKQKLAGDEAAVERAKAATREAELTVKRIELESETCRTTIERLKRQQFETRKNEEFQAFGHEIKRYESNLDAHETRELEAMEQVDLARAGQDQAQAALERSRKIVEDDLAELAQRRNTLVAREAELAIERERLAREVDVDLLVTYQRLMKSKDGLALATLEGGRCGGCHMKLIPSTVINTQSGSEIVRCEDCGRILYAV